MEVKHTVKELLESVAKNAKTYGTQGFSSDQALKEIEAIHQQEITKARIEEVEMFSAGVAPGKYMAPHWYAEDRIKELSQTLKEHKAEL